MLDFSPTGLGGLMPQLADMSTPQTGDDIPWPRSEVHDQSSLQVDEGGESGERSEEDTSAILQVGLFGQTQDSSTLDETLLTSGDSMSMSLSELDL